jgi:predicted Fe-Mo cluster-binding NifX family protein
LECKAKTPAGKIAYVRLVWLQGLEAYVISQIGYKAKNAFKAASPYAALL